MTFFRQLMKILVILLAVTYLISGIVFLTMKTTGGLLFGFALLGGAALLCLAIKAVGHLRNIEDLLIISTIELDEEDYELKEKLELEVEDEIPTDSDTPLTTRSGKKLRGQ